MLSSGPATVSKDSAQLKLHQEEGSRADRGFQALETPTRAADDHLDDHKRIVACVLGTVVARTAPRGQVTLWS